MKISNLIFLSIFFILVMFSLTTYVNFRQSEDVRDNAEFLAVSSNVVRLSNQFQRNILYMERGLRGYVLTSEEYLLPAYDSAFAENKSLLVELDSLISDTSVQQTKLNEMMALYDHWVKDAAEPLINAKQEQQTSATSALVQQKLNEEKAFNRNLQESYRGLLNVEYANRNYRRQKLEDSETDTKQLSVLLTGMSIVVGFIIAVVLARHISSRIRKMVSLANSIASGNYKMQVVDTSNDELSMLTSSLNHMSKMLEENFVQLKRKNEELDQFAHIASHDLKAPLRGIDNVITWIEEDHDAELPLKVQEYLQLIKKRIHRSQNLVQGILTYARVGKEEMLKEQVEVNELLAEVMDGLAVDEKISIEIETGMPVMFTERVLLSQVFTNLVSNAVKYLDKPSGHIKIYHRDAGDHIEFFVEDDGPGIAPAYHEKIFQIFQTLQERDSFESTGVGLSIVKKIMDDRNEHIKINSEAGKGSVFSFTWKK